jgi:hypothetical protein
VDLALQLSTQDRKMKKERYEQDEDLYSLKPKHIISDSGWFILFKDLILKRFQARFIWAS